MIKKFVASSSSSFSQEKAGITSLQIAKRSSPSLIKWQESLRKPDAGYLHQRKPLMTIPESLVRALINGRGVFRELCQLIILESKNVS